MKIFSELKRIVTQLEVYTGSWAVCGGVAASIYRNSPRFTNDIDIALINYQGTSAEDLAKAVIDNLGYKSIVGFVPDPERPLQQLKALICCRSNLDEPFVGIDFLLPVLSWVPKAVQVAQANKLDYGFALVPTVTPEDLVLAKLHALQSPNSRPYDLDDITEIANGQQLNLEYLLRQAKALRITIAASTLNILKKT